jgi:hypothetical protein
MKSRSQKKGLRKSFRQRISRKNQHRMPMFGGFKTKEECQESVKNWAEKACVKYELWHPNGNLESELSREIKRFGLYQKGFKCQNCPK